MGDDDDDGDDGDDGDLYIMPIRALSACLYVCMYETKNDHF